MEMIQVMLSFFYDNTKWCIVIFSFLTSLFLFGAYLLLCQKRSEEDIEHLRERYRFHDRNFDDIHRAWKELDHEVETLKMKDEKIEADIKNIMDLLDKKREVQ
jgi:predicted RND superfamily exporter protein